MWEAFCFSVKPGEKTGVWQIVLRSITPPAERKLKPASSVDEIIQFMIVNYHGIQTGYVLTECFKVPHVEGKYKPEDMFEQLAKSVILMMGGKVKK